MILSLVLCMIWREREKTDEKGGQDASFFLLLRRSDRMNDVYFTTMVMELLDRLPEESSGFLIRFRFSGYFLYLLLFFRCLEENVLSFCISSSIFFSLVFCFFFLSQNFTKYIPLSVWDLNMWLGTPAIYVFDCSGAGNLLGTFRGIAEQRESDRVCFYLVFWFVHPVPLLCHWGFCGESGFPSVFNVLVFNVPALNILYIRASRPIYFPLLYRLVVLGE